MLYYPTRTFLLQRGFLLSPGSNDIEIKELLTDLVPYKTDKELIRIGGDADGGYLIRTIWKESGIVFLRAWRTDRRSSLIWHHGE